MQGGKELVQITEVIFAELPRSIALPLQNRGERHGLRRDADVRARLSYRRQASADRQLAGDQIRAARRTTGFGVVVGESHAFGGKPVEIRRLPRHNSLVISPDVEPTDIVTHDD